MIKFLAVLFFIYLSPLKNFSQAARCDTINWTENARLRWLDFRGAPDTSVPVKAISAPEIGYAAKTKNDTLIIDLYCRFLTCDAWTKSGTANLLQHEQTHFDITEYHKRLFIQKILATQFARQDPYAQLDIIYEEIIKLRDDFDKDYDANTDFSRNQEQQVKWSKDVRSKINKLKPINRKRIVTRLKG